MPYCEILTCWQCIPCPDHSDAPREQVLLVGLSANPPTYRGGHVGIMEYFARGKQFDQIWALPVYSHMFVTKRELAPFEHRVAMLKLALGDVPKVKVVEVERELGEAAVNYATKAGLPLHEVRVGTVDVLCHLQRTFPHIEFSLVLGTDTYADLAAGKWKRGDEILRRWRVVVIDRSGLPPIPDSSLSPKHSSPLKLEVVRVAIPDLTEVSSTRVRASRDDTLLSHALHPKVLGYIQEHKLYAYSGL